MKTRLEWLKTLRRSIRKRAIQNCIDQNVDLYREYNSLTDVLSNSFVWSNTPESYNYWWEVDRLAMKGDKSILRKRLRNN
jgi:hypothetical protein